MTQTVLSRNEEIRKGYSCLHSADAFYIELAEELAQNSPAEIFDLRQAGGQRSSKQCSIRESESSSELILRDAAVQEDGR